MSMTPDYNKPPYAHWVKCPHTCPHTNSVNGSRRPAHLRTLVFDQDGVQTAALHADYIHPFSAPSLAMHACLKSKHEFCNKDNCDWTHILADNNKPLPNGTTCQIRQNLTAEDWQKHGVALAILYSDHHNFYQVPAEYYDRALPILQQHLTPEKYNAVLEKRNPPAKAKSGIRIVGDNILESTAGPSVTIHGTSQLSPPHDASSRQDPPPPRQQNDIDRNTNQTHRRSHSPPPHQNDTNRSPQSPLPPREVSKIPTLKADGVAPSNPAPQENREKRKASEIPKIEEDLDSLTSDEEDSAVYKGLVEALQALEKKRAKRKARKAVPGGASKKIKEEHTTHTLEVIDLT